ncbi:MAG: hypothetical protein A2511_17815 [Deltaproteobacteria bacterium RIFOXYD12_FULL_50_9]|nr:MAG: hypothetical protein A2511_17815 [Deltaproteobacteria bacterium RIFOXYD12_FULL_50_9]
MALKLLKYLTDQLALNNKTKPVQWVQGLKTGLRRKHLSWLRPLPFIPHAIIVIDIPGVQLECFFK